VSLSAISKAIRKQVVVRDRGYCQYCGLRQRGQAAIFHIDHIVPKSKGGRTEPANLALQCTHCSLHKSDKVAAMDPATNDVVALFHPLQQQWHEHFAVEPNGTCRGLTPTGRATVDALGMNEMHPRSARAIQIRLGLLAL
jgi:hypothetical protein